MLACWHAEMVTCWYCDMLTIWKYDNLTCWYAGMLKCWYADIMKYWKGDMLKSVNGDMLTCWHTDMLICWHADMLTCWHADIWNWYVFDIDMSFNSFFRGSHMFQCSNWGGGAKVIWKMSSIGGKNILKVFSDVFEIFLVWVKANFRLWLLCMALVRRRSLWNKISI